MWWSRQKPGGRLWPFVLASASMACANTTAEQDYRRFADRNTEHQHPVVGKAFEERVLRADQAGAPKPPQLEGVALHDAIADALNIAFLLGRARDTTWIVVASREEDGVITQDVELQDSQVGTLQVRVLMPSAAGVHPAILGLHGHEDDKDIFLARFLGSELARAGHVVVAPTFRAMACDDEENGVALYLAHRGMTLMGVRVYEALVTLDFMRRLPQVDVTRVGLLSHSGGSSVANLLVRLSNDVAAQVTDYDQEYRDICGHNPYLMHQGIHCETVPALYDLSPLINDPATMTIPRLLVPYGFGDAPTRQRILEFFSEHLR